MVEQSTEFAPGVRLAPTLRGDEYFGTVEALLEAGIVRPEQLPGAAGNGRTMVSFHPDGRRVGKGNSSAHYQVGYLKVCQSSHGRLRVVKGIGADAERAREKAWREQREYQQAETLALQRGWPFPIICGVPV